VEYGFADEGYGPVADAFRANFTDHGEVGASFALYVGGREAVNLAGGRFAPESERPYDLDTLQLVFSTTKGATALCAHLLAQRGQLDLDAPVASYWPGFEAAGKAEVPVRWLLSHQVGLPTVDTDLSVEDLLAGDPAVGALAAQEPFWPPGSAHGYHAVTYGWLVGEVVRRVSGRSLGRYLADEVVAPLGLELWIGLPEELEDRVSPVLTAPLPEDPDLLQAMLDVFGPGTLGWRALTVNGRFPFGEAESPFNLREFHAAEIPAGNAITNARSLARMYAACVDEVDGMRLLDDAQVAKASVCQTSGVDRCLAVESRFGLGFMLDSPLSRLPTPRSFGHYGAGGSVGFGDPDLGLGFGYAMNQMKSGLADDPRTRGLMDAVLACSS
jgi:CubicO group peptidase (beta-lactamase class C family)